MSETVEEYIQWMHDCPPDHELRLRAIEGQIQATCVDLSVEEEIPPMSGQAVKWSGVHQITVDWEWTGAEFVVSQVEVYYVTDADAT